MRISHLIIAVGIVCNANAQEVKPIDGRYDFNYFKYSWDETFVKSDYEAQLESADSSVVILDRQIISYELGKYNMVNRRRFDHKLYYVGNERDIEKVNRLYLYKGGAQSKLTVKVRTITQSGKLVDLDVSKMEDVSTDKGASSYTILAIPGIEVHSFVEVLIEKVEQPAHIRCLVNNPFKTLTAEVHIYHAPNLLKLASGKRVVRRAEYGGFSIVTEANSLKSGDSTSRIVGVDYQSQGLVPSIYAATNVPPSTTEKYSHEYDGMSRVDIVDMDYSWEEAGQGIGSNIFPDVKKYGMNGSSWIRKLGIQDTMLESTKLRLIEEFIKLTLTETNADDLHLSRTDLIWKKRIANEEGLLKMSMQLIDATKIPYEVYLCSDKDYIQMDSDFPFTIGLRTVLYYFPTLDLYMVPTNSYYRLGEIPNYLTSSSALLIRASDPPKVGKVKELPDAKMEYNVDGTRSVITIDTEQEITTVHKSKYFYGDNAIRSRGHYYFDNEAGRKEYFDDILTNRLEGMELTDVVVQNEKFSLNFQSSDTVIYSGVLTGTDLLSTIPNGFILNPGKVIGIQTSFYDRDERVSSVFIPTSKVYEHTIEVQIPEGYSVEGLDNLQFDHAFDASSRRNYQEVSCFKAPNDNPQKAINTAEEMKNDEGDDAPGNKSGIQAARFTSVATVESGILKIKIREFYLEGFYPKDEYAALQNVVNAAYEFYIAKIKLVKN